MNSKPFQVFNILYKSQNRAAHVSYGNVPPIVVLRMSCHKFNLCHKRMYMIYQMQVI
jgi:hypothetical protein